jgi:hypothetical protein
MVPMLLPDGRLMTRLKLTCDWTKEPSVSVLGLVLHSAVLADPATLQRPNDTALAAVKIGTFRLAVTLDSVEHGKVLVVGQRLYLPVEARGTARLDYAGRR